MSALRVAIVHYHLRPGGVTSVISRAAGALQQAGHSCALLCGEAPAAALPGSVPVCLVEGLGYADAAGRPDRLAEAMSGRARAALGGLPDLWHIHNHALGKNPALTGATGILAGQGRRLLLQVHDFAEDGRPLDFQRLANHIEAPTLDALGSRLYPQGAGIHYAVLSRRDARFLAAAGLDEGRLHVLPNPVEPPLEASCAPAEAGAAPLYVYPTRGIRRKNLGEFLLWSAANRGSARFALTLSPLNPRERPAYDAWKALAAGLGLPVAFEAGAAPGASFPALLRGARAAVSTSVAEGFGLAFLEPFAAGRPVLGRNLPEITLDFINAGIDLDALYDRLSVPCDWVDAGILREKATAALRAMRLAYGLKCGPADADRALQSMRSGDTIDFGRLDEELQAVIVRKIGKAPELARHMKPATLEARFPANGVIGRNRELVLDRYGPARYAQRLAALYRLVLDDTAPATPVFFSESRLVGQFNEPERLFLLRA